MVQDSSDHLRLVAATVRGAVLRVSPPYPQCCASTAQRPTCCSSALADTVSATMMAAGRTGILVIISGLSASSFSGGMQNRDGIDGGVSDTRDCVTRLPV